jgi:RNA polymerase sigma-70 factor (ECF subfamily)
VTTLVPRWVESSGVLGPASGAASPAFEAVYAEYFSFVWRCLRALGVRLSSLDDATQDVFVVVHRRLPHFEGRSTMRTWLFGITRNVASNHRRSHARKGEKEAAEEDVAGDDPGPQDVAQDRQAAEFIRGFLRNLDEPKRELFVLCLLEELSVPEAAEALGLPLNTAYTRLRRVRAEFRRALDERGDGT